MPNTTRSRPLTTRQRVRNVQKRNKNWSRFNPLEVMGTAIRHPIIYTEEALNSLMESQKPTPAGKARQEAIRDRFRPDLYTPQDGVSLSPEALELMG